MDVAERSNCLNRTSAARFRGRLEANSSTASANRFVRCSRSFSIDRFLLSTFYFLLPTSYFLLPTFYFSSDICPTSLQARQFGSIFENHTGQNKRDADTWKEHPRL